MRAEAPGRVFSTDARKAGFEGERLKLAAGIFHGYAKTQAHAGKGGALNAFLRAPCFPDRDKRGAYPHAMRLTIGTGNGILPMAMHGHGHSPVKRPPCRPRPGAAAAKARGNRLASDADLSQPEQVPAGEAARMARPAAREHPGRRSGSV